MAPRKIVIHGFETSNNIKVLLALAHKGIPYEFRKIDPGDRTEIARVSGQSLTPVMVDGDTVLFDSAAILRYLDANFPDTPKLFGRDRREQWEIEDWERFGRGPLAGPMSFLVHARTLGEDPGPDGRARAVKQLHEAVHRLEARLTDREWLVGAELSAADITCGAVIHRIRTSGVLPLPEDCPRTLAHADRVMRLLG